MKSNVLIVIISLIILLTGCNNSEQEESKDMVSTESYVVSNGLVEGEYIFRKVKHQGDYLLLRYNVNNGNVGTVCQDPFCEHKADTCIFYMHANAKVTYIGNTVYFSSFNESGHTVVCKYDEKNMKTENIYSTENQIGQMFAYNYDLYIEIISSDENDIIEREYIVINTLNGEISTLPFETNSVIYEIKNDKITWQKGERYYTSELDGTNITMLAGITDRFGYVYRYELKTGGRDFTMNMYRRQKSSETEELIATGIGPATFYGNKIIYFVPISKNEQKLIYSYEGNDVFDVYGGNVYIMDLDGSNAKLLCHADNCYISGMSPDRDNEWYCGDWVGIQLKDETPNQDNGSTDSGNMLIVNIVTGEYVVCKYEE